MITIESSKTGFRPLEPLRIAVVSGGDSSEREISLKSGEAVARALSERGHQIIPVDPSQIDIHQYRWKDMDVVFLALHGRCGEDGTIQQALEIAGVPFTGSDSHASRLAFSKSAAKERFLQQHVPTLPYVLIHESDPLEHVLNLAQGIGYPLVVKPDTEGSSLGVTIVDHPEGLDHALAECFHFAPFGVLEVAVRGSEFTTGLLNDTLLPLIQVIPHGRSVFDFRAKYQDDETQYLFEFDLPSPVVRQIERVSRQACLALGTRGIARVDLMLDKSNSPWVLEVNTIPGMTDHSLVPKAAARIGWSMGELCERAIASCLPVGVSRTTGS